MSTTAHKPNRSAAGTQQQRQRTAAAAASPRRSSAASAASPRRSAVSAAALAQDEADVEAYPMSLMKNPSRLFEDDEDAISERALSLIGRRPLPAALQAKTARVIGKSRATSASRSPSPNRRNNVYPDLLAIALPAHLRGKRPGAANTLGDEDEDDLREDRALARMTAAVVAEQAPPSKLYTDVYADTDEPATVRGRPGAGTSQVRTASAVMHKPRSKMSGPIRPKH